jgi:glycolate oxidase iron-sulfur subunit
MIQDIELLTSPEYKSKLSQCIHCGLCLPACPTYNALGTEMDTPRGRIALVRAASDGRVDLVDFKDSLTQHINLCLVCRSCETACPSDVNYGNLIEAARIVVEHNRSPGITERFLRWLGAKQLMTNRSLLRFIARILYIYEVIGLQQIVRSANLLPKTLQAMEAILPPMNPHYQDYRVPAPAVGNNRGDVLFFTGCIQEGFLPQVNQATVRVLQRNGFKVHTPMSQTCCGAAHLHLGDIEYAKMLARQNIDAFLGQEGDFSAMICNAGGCGASLKEYPHLLAGDPVYAQKAIQFSDKVKDISEFLVENLHSPLEGELKVRATYSDSCHLRHGQKVVNQPRQLLGMIPGLELVELSSPDLCCGSAGVYNITQIDTADKILDAKMADIAATGANLIVTSNIGCQMQLITGVRRSGLDAKVMHVVEVLDLSYEKVS